MSSGKFAEKLEHFITESMREDHVPGISIAIVKDGRVVYARGFGARCLKDNAPATPDTLYGVGSCTKSFTAMAIMQLAEQGKLSVKDPVGRHLPEFKVGKEKNPITIHNLLTHSSGIPGLSAEWVENSRLMGLSEKWVPFSSFEDFLSLVNDAKDEVAAPRAHPNGFAVNHLALKRRWIGQAQRFKHSSLFPRRLRCLL